VKYTFEIFQAYVSIKSGVALGNLDSAVFYFCQIKGLYTSGYEKNQGEDV
jgi:hypothetical protein